MFWWACQQSWLFLSWTPVASRKRPFRQRPTFWRMPVFIRFMLLPWIQKINPWRTWMGFSFRRAALPVLLCILFFAAGCIGFAYQDVRTMGLSYQDSFAPLHPNSARSENTRTDLAAKQTDTDSRDEKTDPGKSSGRNNSSEGNLCHFHINYVGWTYFPEDRELFARTLQENGIRSEPSSSLLLEITLEQTDITPLWRRLPNVVLTVFTSTLFPLVEYFEYELTFRLISADRAVLLRKYRLMSHTILSGLVTPLTPFYYPPTARREALAEAATDFAPYCHTFFH